LEAARERRRIATESRLQSRERNPRVGIDRILRLEGSRGALCDAQMEVGFRTAVHREKPVVRLLKPEGQCGLCLVNDPRNRRFLK
jgi:hypothetical protein